MLKSLPFLIFLLFYGFAGFGQCDDLKPMFGDKCTKTAAVKKADNKFIKAEIKKYGTPDSAANVYVAIAWSHFYRRDPETAMKRLNQAWLLNRESPAVFFGFGHLTRYAFRKDVVEAEKYYKLGRDRDLKHIEEPKSWLVMMSVAESQNDLNTAIDVSSQLVQGFPEFGKGFGYKKRAYYYIQAQLFQNALDDCNKAIALDPADANSYAIRGFAYYWLHQNDKALADYNQALTLSPEVEQAYYNRALLYFDRLEDNNAALNDIEKAIALESKEPQYQKLKSDILFKLNRKAEACSCLKNAISLGNKTSQEDYDAKCAR